MAALQVRRRGMPMLDGLELGRRHLRARHVARVDVADGELELRAVLVGLLRLAQDADETKVRERINELLAKDREGTPEGETTPPAATAPKTETPAATTPEATPATPPAATTEPAKAADVLNHR